MAADTVAPLCTAAQLKDGPLADLFRSYGDDALGELLMEATRACEDECQRRLAPFTGMIETIRTDGIDPDEYVDSGAMPLDLQGSLGRNWASAFGSTALVRRVHLAEYAPRYPDLWSYANVAISVYRSYGGNQPVLPNGRLVMGPQPDTGFVWFQLGTFIPGASVLEVRYDGGYATVPASLSRACKYLAASIAVADIDPSRDTGHDPGELEARAVAILDAYARA